MRLVVFILLSVLLVSPLAGAWSYKPAPQTPEQIMALQASIDQTFEEVPLRVVDGDTLKMRNGAVRLWGFDTPEKLQPFYFAAAGKLEELTMGQKLSCHVLDIDRYGRRVAQCFLPSGQDLGALMVGSGLARDYTKYSKGYYKPYEHLRDGIFVSTR